MSHELVLQLLEHVDLDKTGKPVTRAITGANNYISKILASSLARRTSNVYVTSMDQYVVLANRQI